MNQPQSPYSQFSIPWTTKVSKKCLSELGIQGTASKVTCYLTSSYWGALLQNFSYLNHIWYVGHGNQSPSYFGC